MYSSEIFDAKVRPQLNVNGPYLTAERRFIEKAILPTIRDIRYLMFRKKQYRILMPE